MRRIALLACLLLFATFSAGAQTSPGLYAAVPLLPLTAGAHPDIEALLQARWHDYFRAGGDYGFDLDQVRAGRVDLDGDEAAELVLMINAPAWAAPDGKPFVVAAWARGHWVPVGWGWADEDRVFVTTEVVKGWRTIDAGNYIMRWDPKEGYLREHKPG